MKRIVLCRTDAIGDLILTLPVARSIKESSPDLHVTMLVSKYTRPLLQEESYLDDIMTLPHRSLGSLGEIHRLARRLRAGEFDAFICFYPRFSLALAAFQSGIKVRIGTAYRGYSLLFNRRVRLHRRESGKHELDLNYDLVDPFCPGLIRHEPHLTVSDKEIAATSPLLASYGISLDDHFVVIHPLSRGSAPNWRLENYLLLARKLAEAGQVVILTGSAAERQLLNESIDCHSQSIINLAGLTDLSQLKALLKMAALTISGSTGPIHISSAVGTPAIGIYPPIAALSPTRWGPRGKSNKLFVPKVDSDKSDSAEVMGSISVETVFDFALSKLQFDSRLEPR